MMKRSIQLLGATSASLSAGPLVVGQKVTNISSLLGPCAVAKGMSLLEVQGCLCSIYLAVDHNQRTAMMIDGGTSSDLKLIQRVLGTLNEKNPNGQPFTLAGCVSTHAHPDHMGSCAGWQKEGVPVVLSRDALQWYSGVGGSFQYSLDIVLGSLVRHKQGHRYKSIAFSLPTLEAPNTASLADMTPLPLGLDKFGWTPVYSPGHTDHMFTMYNPDGKTLYVSDLIVMPRNVPRPPIPIEVPQAYINTLDRLQSDFEVDHMLLPHGGVVHTADHGGWKAIVDSVRKRAQTEKSLVRDYLCGWNTVLRKRKAAAK